MQRVKMPSEIFQAASEMPMKADRIQYLRDNANEVVRYIVQGAYHPNVIWLLPKGIPPFKESHTKDTEGEMYRQYGRLYLFCKGGRDDLKQFQREKLFVDMLSVLHPNDARLLCAMKDKYINYPFLTYDLFKEAFPDWLPDRLEDKPVIIKTDGKLDIKSIPNPSEMLEQAVKEALEHKSGRLKKGDKMSEEMKQKLSEAGKERWRKYREEKEKNNS